MRAVVNGSVLRSAADRRRLTETTHPIASDISPFFPTILTFCILKERRATNGSPTFRSSTQSFNKNASINEKPMDRENFNRLQQASQRRIFAFILTLVPNRTDAEEILQETNLIIWRKRDQFESGTNFLHWANRVAYLEAIAYSRRQRRHWLWFDSELSESLAELASEMSESLDVRIDLLQGCMKMLPEKDRRLIEERYLNDSPVKSVAEVLGRSIDAIYKALARIRITLHSCIEKKLKAS